MKISIYDNQSGYFEFIKENLSDKYQLEHINHNNFSEKGVETSNALLFFLSDELEMIDFVKLKQPETYTILCSPQNNHLAKEDNGSNPVHVDINLKKEELVNSIVNLLP